MTTGGGEQHRLQLGLPVVLLRKGELAEEGGVAGALQRSKLARRHAGGDLAQRQEAVAVAPGDEVEDIVALLADADAGRRKRARAVHREEELERELPLLDEDLAQ